MKDTPAEAGETAAGYRRLILRSRLLVDSESNWLITMTDVMTLLLVFFVVVFLMTKRGARSEGETVPEEVIPGIVPVPRAFNTADELKREVDAVIEALDAAEDVVVEVVDREVVITIKERITFRPAEAEILKEAEPVLDGIAGIIHRYPSHMIEIDGHTDDVPINTPRYPSNWELSTARAIRVLKYFVNRHGIDASRFYVKGNADKRPVAPNDTPEHRAMNRRVEIRLKETADLLTPPSVPVGSPRRLGRL